MESGKIEDWLNIIKDPKQSVTKKYTSIFQLRQFESIEGARALIEAFEYLKESDLLQHEISYALGQMKMENSEEIKSFLVKIFEDESQYPVVRHEAGEGLSNYCGFFDFIELFKKHTTSQVEEVRDTSILALKKAETFKELNSRYGVAYLGTREPAAPYHLEDFQTLFKEELQKEKELEWAQKVQKYIIQQKQTSLWEQYRSLYFLRDFAEKNQSKEMVKLIAELLLKIHDLNNLFKHEVCFVLGQVGHLGDLTLDIVSEVVKDENENHIVRHEAISAFQAVSGADREFVKQFISDKQAPIVRESAVVAYEMIQYWS